MDLDWEEKRSFCIFICFRLAKLNLRQVMEITHGFIWMVWVFTVAFVMPRWVYLLWIASQRRRMWLGSVNYCIMRRNCSYRMGSCIRGISWRCRMIFIFRKCIKSPSFFLFLTFMHFPMIFLARLTTIHGLLAPSTDIRARLIIARDT